MTQQSTVSSSALIDSADREIPTITQSLSHTAIKPVLMVNTPTKTLSTLRSRSRSPYDINAVSDVVHTKLLDSPRQLQPITELEFAHITIDDNERFHINKSVQQSRSNSFKDTKPSLLNLRSQSHDTTGATARSSKESLTPKPRSRQNSNGAVVPQHSQRSQSHERSSALYNVTHSTPHTNTTSEQTSTHSSPYSSRPSTPTPNALPSSPLQHAAYNARLVTDITVSPFQRVRTKSITSLSSIDEKSAETVQNVLKEINEC